MDEIIEIIEKSLNELNKYVEDIDKKNHEYYLAHMEYMRGVFPPVYKIKEDGIEPLERQLELYKKCRDKDIQLKIDYFLTENIYLSFYLQEKFMIPHFYLLDDKWFYDNFMSSHSELNTWINDLVIKLFDDYLSVDNDGYSVATMSELIYNIRNGQNNSERINDIVKLIDLLTSENEYYKKIREMVVETLELKLNNMKKLLDE